MEDIVGGLKILARGFFDDLKAVYAPVGIIDGCEISFFFCIKLVCSAVGAKSGGGYVYHMDSYNCFKNLIP